jgi:hypothetical protein|nr:MAG TPA: hypothetical protein [Caudoviricetes sp.]
MAKVVNHEYQKLADMQDGDVAEVITWHDEDFQMGDVFQRHGSAAIFIGVPSGDCYPNLFDVTSAPKVRDVQIRILPTGTVIEL